MTRFALLILAGAALAAPAQAQDVGAGFAGAVRGCEAWVLEPATWSDGIDPFLAKMGLGLSAGLVDAAPEAALPPKDLRTGNHFWRINSTEQDGYFLVVSDQLPMCHITGGGAHDMQPAVEQVLASTEFTDRWKQLKSSHQDDMVSTEFLNVEEPAFKLVVSRSDKPGARTDRVQVLATAIFELKD